MVREAADEASALEALHASGSTDGLPVVVPTPVRVERMLLTGGLDPDVLLGTVGPSNGEASVEKVAINAVMAGCLPDHFPVVLAAVRAVVDPEFDLDEVQSTTHNLAPLVIVNGPARHLCGPIASGAGALGPGHRANATIGRALRLVLMNIGGGQPGISDMAVLGHPGKFTYCLAEAEEQSPFPPLHVSLGWQSERSTVTVVGVEAPHSVVGLPSDPDDPAGPERILASLAGALAGVGANSTYLARGCVVVVLNPLHARTLAHHGHDRASVQRGLFERARHPRGELRALVGDQLIAAGDDDEALPVVQAPEDIVLVVAGAEGYYSAVMPNWGGGAHGNRAVTKEIDTNLSCEIPGRGG